MASPKAIAIKEAQEKEALEARLSFLEKELAKLKREVSTLKKANKE